jgi:transcriptional regulator with PAS, ATPase and Fis domain
MIESIKTKIWALLKEKEVSLAMIYNKNGDILWSKGRNIVGRNIHEGEGFSKTYVKQSLNSTDTFEQEYVVIESSAQDLPQSAFKLFVKSLIIQPISDQYFLYVDSGRKHAFSDTDREVFHTLGELLGEMINNIRNSRGEIVGITGDSEETKKIRDQVLRYSLEDQPVLLLGETGVGKSHIAELIHIYSGRKGKFVTIHTPTIPDNLFESEVFGHKKGAFTDAKTDKRGLVEEAARGTLFFDEISEVPVTFQAKLLRFIETRKYMVLGGTTEIESDVRIVAATNRDLHQAIEMKEFREDLYYRLHILEIEIPPLRKRKEDIKTLVMEKMELLKEKEPGEGFWEAVYSHDWPGNVRELITVLIRAGIHCENPITGKDILEIIDQTHYKKSPDQQDNKMDRMWENIKTGQDFWEAVWQPFIDRDIDREAIKEFLKDAYAKGRHSFKKMAEILNLDKKGYHTLMSLMRKYKIDPRT